MKVLELLNSTVFEGKQYTLDDVRGFIPNESKGIPEGFYGGRVTKLAKTDVNGMYLCMENMKVIDILVYEDEMENLIVSPEDSNELPFTDYETLTNKQLIDLLEDLGIEYPKKATKPQLIALLEKE